LRVDVRSVDGAIQTIITVLKKWIESQPGNNRLLTSHFVEYLERNMAWGTCLIVFALGMVVAALRERKLARKQFSWPQVSGTVMRSGETMAAVFKLTLNTSTYSTTACKKVHRFVQTQSLWLGVASQRAWPKKNIEVIRGRCLRRPCKAGTRSAPSENSKMECLPGSAPGPFDDAAKDLLDQ
jgi:hypothetical protein